MRIIKFETTTCTGCKMLRPVLKKLVDEHNNITIEVADVLTNPTYWELAKTLEICNFPTLAIVDDNNKLVAKLYGVRTLTTIKNFLRDNGAI